MRALKALAFIADPLLAAAVASLHARALRGSKVAELALVATAVTVRRAAQT
jgi:hypothetical protein